MKNEITANKKINYRAVVLIKFSTLLIFHDGVVFCCGGCNNKIYIRAVADCIN